jgi:hypothetical protein
MRNHSHRSSSAIEGLRLAIDCMPVATRQAMLHGVRANPRVIVGAYVDGEGGVCPMLAAHRAGGRTDFLSFAKSWDRFTHARGKSREATEREITILLSQLQDSLECDDGTELDVAIKEHHVLMARSLRTARQRDTESRRLPDEGDPSGEIRARRLRAPWRNSARERPAGVPAFSA